jgi:hypothetical protein
VLTVADLRRTLEDERHHGAGFTDCDVLDKRRYAQVERKVVEVANELGLSYDLLFHWSNSKYGRWLADAVYGRGEDVDTAVRGHLNREAMVWATEGVALERDDLAKVLS